MKTKKRTPRKMLSLLLCVLMLMPSVAIVNPFTAAAATSITHVPAYSSRTFTYYCTQQGFGVSTTVTNVEYTENSNVRKAFMNSQDTETGYAYSVYDYNPNATNYDIPKFDSSKISCGAAYSTSPSYEYQIYSYKMGDYNRPYVYVKRVVYGINTTNMIAAYDNAMSTIGTVNTEHYSTATWNNYISALNVIKTYIDEGGAGYSYNGGNPQGWIYNATQNLKKAISLLSKAEVSLGNIFKQVEGAILEGPSKVYVGEKFQLTVTLQEGYTQSVPLVVASYSDGSSATQGGTKTGTNTYTINFTISKEGINYITPINVKKNTYKVTVPTSATGLTITKGGTNTVTHGDEFSFTVTKQTGYTQATPVVKANGTQIGGVQNGNTHTYTINVTADTSITINGLALNTYNVGYSLGAGTSMASGTAATIKHNGTATVKITVDPEYSQRTPAPSVSNGTITYVSKSGTTYTYTLSGVTADTTVTVPALAKNQYTVTIPTGTGYSLDATSKTVTHGDTTSFTVTLDGAYSQNAPVARIDGKALSYTKNGNSYTFTTEAITANKTVSIENVQINKYQYTLPTGTGFTVSDASGMDHSAITHGTEYRFVVSVNKAYTQTVPTVTLASGKTLELVSTAPGADGSINYTYKAANVTAHDTVQVAEMSKNTYTAVLPTGTGYTAKTEDDLSKIVYGTSISFGVELEKQYDRSNVVVKYNGTVLEPTAGVYKIDNITSNITEGMITVEGVELNHYYITLPLETETGFTIIVGEGQNAKSVLSGTDFDFKFFLDPAYSNSNPVIKYSEDGGDHYKVLTETDGKFTIENVLSDCIVVVEGVKKNTYTVSFTNEDGTVIKEYKDVEYGSEVVFDGAEPAKASEKLNEYTDEDGNNVVITKEYKFVGWSADTTKVVSNMTVTPIFEVSEVKTTTPAEGGGDPIIIVTPKTANILFISGGVIVHKETITKGESFSGWNGVPVKNSSNPYETYTFVGWDIDRDGVVDFAAGETNAIADVQKDVTFTAVFESNLPSQTVSFYNFDGSELLYSASVKRGEEAVYGLSAIPSRKDNTNNYDFAGWALTADADETAVVEKVIVAEEDINLYAAYAREAIVYSYKFVNDGVTLQEGTFYNGDIYKYLGATPTRASSVSTDYTFDGWSIAQSGYTTVYTATYSESVREYDSNLPISDGTYTISENKTVKYGDTFEFTVTVNDGYEETAPVVTSNGTPIEPADVSGNTYTYQIKLDGATAEEVNKDLTVTVGTIINVYDVAINGDAGCDVVPVSLSAKHGGEGTFTVTLKTGYTQTAPVVTKDGNIVLELVSTEGNVYTYKLTDINSDAEITVRTKINEYTVVMTNYDGTEVFNGIVKHGEAPAYENPTKPTDKFGGYTFIGWDIDGDSEKDVDAIANVTGDITAKAVYECNHVHAEDPTGDDTAWVLVSTEKATCTEDGVRHYKCSYPECPETKDWVIKARGHQTGDWTVTVEPTCTEDGSMIRYCENEANDDYEGCTYSETEVVPMLGHAYGEWVTVVEPTCTETGKAERICANDASHKEYKVLEATGHHDSDDDYICDDCGEDLGHCTKCVCHKGNVLSKVIRYICTLLSKIFHTEIKCCKCMDWYNGTASSIS